MFYVNCLVHLFEKITMSVSSNQIREILRKDNCLTKVEKLVRISMKRSNWKIFMIHDRRVNIILHGLSRVDLINHLGLKMILISQF